MDCIKSNKPDYTTNAESYYKQLSRINEILKIMAKMVDEQNETMQLYIELLDDKLSKFDESVLLLLEEWLQNGTFEDIIKKHITDGILSTKLDVTVFNDFLIEFDDKLTELENKQNEKMKKISWITPVANGVDDTENIQTTIDACYQNGGGVVTIPNGEYWIKADVGAYHTNYLRDVGGIALKDNVHLKLSKGTVLKAIPNGESQYVVLRIYNKKNVTVTGGTILGERYQHSGTAGEWGYGIAITGGENIILEDIKLSDFWGDGINLQAYREEEHSIGTNKFMPKNITIRNIISDKNLRQGMSIEACDGLLVENCIFKNTGGKLPESGVDIEPWTSEHYTKNITFFKCRFLNNKGGGLLITRNTTENVKVIDCDFDNLFENILIEGPVKKTVIENCNFVNNRIKVRSGIDVIINKNFFNGVALSVMDAKNVFFTNNIIQARNDLENDLSLISIADFAYGERHNINIVIENNIIEGYLHLNAQGVITNLLQTRGISLGRVTSGRISNNTLRNLIIGIGYYGTVDEMTIDNNVFSVIAERGIYNVERTVTKDNKFYGGNFNNDLSVIYGEYKNHNVIMNNILFRNKGVYENKFTGLFVSELGTDSNALDNIEIDG